MSGGLQNIDNVSRNVPEPKETAQEKETSETKSDTAETPISSDRVLLEWQGKSFEYKEKGARWFVILGLVVTAIIAYLVWQKDWFTIAITLVVTGVLLWYVKTARPADQTYAISTLGITVSGHYYSFSDIHSFWMVYNPKVQKLFFVQNKKYLPSIVMDISDVSPERVKIILSRKIPEQQSRGENILDKLLRLLQL